MKQILSKEQFELEIRQASRQAPIFVMFTSPTCEPCKRTKPVLETIADDNLVTIAIIDIAETPDLAVAQGIRSVPSLMAFKGGFCVDQLIGISTASSAREFVEQHSK